MTAQDFVQRFMDAALDQANTRWKAPEVIRYANDGQRDIALHRPDAFTTTGELTTVAGTRQALPEGATKLLRALHNVTGGKRVRIVTHEDLDASVPSWHAAKQASVIVNIAYDERFPLEWYCYPPSDGTAKVLAGWSITPTDIPTPSGDTKATCTGNVSVSDLFVNALLDYVLYRAYAKDSGIEENLEKARFRYQLYADAIGIEEVQRLRFGPNANSPQAPRTPPTKPAL